MTDRWIVVEGFSHLYRSHLQTYWGACWWPYAWDLLKSCVDKRYSGFLPTIPGDTSLRSHWMTGCLEMYPHEERLEPIEDHRSWVAPSPLMDDEMLGLVHFRCIDATVHERFHCQTTMYTPKTPQPMRPKTGKGTDCFFRRVRVKGFGPWNLANESHPIKLNELQANSWRWTCWCFGLEFSAWWFLCLETVVGCSLIVHQAELPPKNPGKNHCHFFGGDHEFYHLKFRTILGPNRSGRSFWSSKSSWVIISIISMV